MFKDSRKWALNTKLTNYSYYKKKVRKRKKKVLKKKKATTLTFIILGKHIFLRKDIYICVGQFYPGLQQCKGKGPAQYPVWGDMNIRGRPANERAKLPSEERCSMLTGSGSASEDYGHLGTFVRGAWLACWSLGTVPRTIIQRHKGENIQQKVVVDNSKYLVMLSPPH